MSAGTCQYWKILKEHSKSWELPSNFTGNISPGEISVECLFAFAQALRESYNSTIGIDKENSNSP